MGEQNSGIFCLFVCKIPDPTSTLLDVCAQIENSAEEFALYIVHTSGGEAAGGGSWPPWWPGCYKNNAFGIAEKQKLRATDYPLIARVLQGPCEQVSKVFLMEKDQVEEVTYDVSFALGEAFCLSVFPVVAWAGKCGWAPPKREIADPGHASRLGQALST